MAVSAKTKTIVSRVGLGAMVAGVIAILIVGGDPDAALATAGQIAVIGGVVLEAIRELFN